MEPEGTPSDDLNVRLNWPGDQPAGEADLAAVDPNSGGPVEPSATRASDDALDAPSNGMEAPPYPAPSPPLAAEPLHLQAALRSISERLDALAGASNSQLVAIERALADPPLTAALERLEHSIATLLQQAALSGDRVRDSVGAIDEEVKKVSTQQAELRQRVNEIAHEIETMRRRMTLRARTEHALSAEAIQLIADSVVDRLSAATNSSVEGSGGTRSGRPARRR